MYTWRRDTPIGDGGVATTASVKCGIGEREKRGDLKHTFVFQFKAKISTSLNFLQVHAKRPNSTFGSSYEHETTLITLPTKPLLFPLTLLLHSLKPHH